MSLAADILRHIEGLAIAQGRYAGQPFPLHPWERQFIRGAFAQPDDAAMSLGRGNGKTTLTAAIASAAVDVDGPLVEPMAECLVVASSFDQGANSCFRHLLAFMQPSFERHGMNGRGARFRVQDSANRATITDRETGAMVRVVGSDPRRLHGAAPKLLIYDEMAQWPPEKLPAMLAALKTSRGKIQGSKALWLGTRPATPDHPLEKALNGHGVGFALCYKAEKDDPPFRRKTWKKANPGLDYLPDLEDVIRREAEEAKRDPEALQTFRALRLNQGVSDVLYSVLIDADTWRGAEALGEPDEPGRARYVLGIDAGQDAAMSAASAYFEDGRLETVAAFPELPSLSERGLSDGVGNLYVRMHERGELIIAGRRVSDLSALLREARSRWGRPSAIVCDRWRDAELKDALEAARFPLAALIVRGQGFKDGAADVRDFRRAVLSDLVRPAASLLLRAALSEARTIGDPAGNRKMAKNAQGGRRAHARDDAAASAVLAVAAGYRRWHAKPQKRRRRRRYYGAA